jgi:hypothetical protein
VGVVHLADEEYQLLDIEPVVRPVLDDPSPRNTSKGEPMLALGIELVECIEVSDEVALQHRLRRNVLRKLDPVPLHLGGERVPHAAAHNVLIEQDGY